MRIGFVGLGRMGLGLALRAQKAGHEPVGWDLSHNARARAEKEGLSTAPTLDALVADRPLREARPQRDRVRHAPGDREGVELLARSPRADDIDLAALSSSTGTTAR
ncbi:MAG: NAD(P)-binding domain-containing protein [Nitriliruptorales bacterium]